jgi:probable F420-dependent oxidoreductase
MAKIEFGTAGVVLTPDEGGAYLGLAAQLEELGYTTLSTGGPIDSLQPYRDLVEATSHVRITGSIISVDRFAADDVAALYHDLESAHPGRFVLGLGGAHGPQPLATLGGYLDRLDAAGVGPTTRILAALGPRMVDLARDRAAGALPVLVTPAYTAEARQRLGDDRTLVVQQLVAPEADPDRARSLARGPLGFLGNVPAYQANFRRMGFTDQEITERSDRLVDALVAWGEPAAIAAHLHRHLDAGADHVLISPVSAPADALSVDPWRQLAKHLFTP